MGFWNRSEPTPPPAEQGGQVPTPFTRERMAEYMQREEYSYDLDSDGDVMTGFKKHGFYLLANGAEDEVLTVRGRWNRSLPADQRYALLDALNDWAVERIWPKGYVREDDDGTLAVFGEFSVDLEDGATDEQLAQYLDCGISTCLGMFDELDQRFPEDGNSLGTPSIDL